MFALANRIASRELQRNNFGFRLSKLFVAFVLVFLFGFTGPFLFAGGKSETGRQDESLHVTVSILPQKYFVQRIAGEQTKVTVIVPPGKGPATYEPTPRQIAEIGKSDVFFRIGVPFEDSFVPKLATSLPELTIVDTSKSIDKRRITGSAADQEAGNGRGDPHIWLGPEEVKQQSRIIRDTLVQLRPQQKEDFDKGYRGFVSDIDELVKNLRRILQPLEGRTLYVFHPAFGYFCDTFDLEQRAIETGGDEPTPRQLQMIIKQAREEGVKVIFVQPQFAKGSAEDVAEAIGGAVVHINPLDPDWMNNMRNIAETIREGLREN
ncbi:MAG: zinc ABC transporter substrate-binding protein [Spirochaetales bacterium]|nr:zinc ABC transporter substrate-binding protein [Spirochaetales bacterium]MCF7938492.1 zinc ABC transporter substrate-binding protein [Spirochaetales bacterium]